MSYNFIWEPQPALPSQPDLFGWPGGDSDPEDLNDALSANINNANISQQRSRTIDSASSLSCQIVASCNNDDSNQHEEVNSVGIALKVPPSSSAEASNSSTLNNSFNHSSNEVSKITAISSSSASSPAFKHAHTFVKKSFHRPAYCHHCSEVMWGLMTVGFVCEVCNFLVHEKCLSQVFSLCTTIASTAVARPLSHCWTEPGTFKRKFCNVCRKKLDDSPAIRCEICEYHSHIECQDYVVNNCKEGAAYTPNLSLLNFKQFHHWLEGNLPPNSKCIICNKNCYSSECMAGYRCEWCGNASHTICFKQIPIECKFGPLKNIILPPSSVCIPRTKISMESIIGVSKRSNAKSTSEDWTDEDSKEESFIDKRSLKDQNEKEKHEDYAKVFDGNGSLKRRVYRYFNYNKSMSSQTVIEQCLKAFHIFGKSDEYCMCEINEKDGRESPLDDKSNFKTQLTFNSKRPIIILRHKDSNEQTRGKLKIYPGDLVYCAQVTSKYKEVPINKKTTSKEVIIMAMRRFQCESLNINNFQLVEVCLDRSVTERPIGNDEFPWDIIQRLRKDSIRSLRLTRFYLKAIEDPHGPGVTIFVGNLVENLNQNVYEKMLLEKLGVNNKWTSMEVIYYESGCLVLSYTCGEKAEICYEILKDTEIKDRPLMVMILPRIIPRMIPDDITPLLVFVNLKSGGCQGTQLITAFRKLLNPHQVFNLEYGGPLPGLYCFRQVKNYKILVCGGDGTVGWTLSCLDSTGQDAACNSPPIAVLPLGTGNDLARVLRWGGGYTSGETPLKILKDVVIAEELKLDRWTLVVKSDDPDKDEAKLALQIETNTLNTNEDSSILIIMNNYFGVGLDADLALDFHNARSENPNKFNSRMHNKTVYLKMGLRKMVYRTTCKDLHKQIVLEADGHTIDLPQIEGLIILNIMSWGGGANPWGPEKDDKFVKPTHYDGLLEVIGVSGMIHMGQIYSGIRNGIRICQAGHLKITLKNDLPVQVDGEPFIQSPGTITVLKSALRAIMLKKTKLGKRRKTDSSYIGPSSIPLPLMNCSSNTVANCSYRQ